MVQDNLPLRISVSQQRRRQPSRLSRHQHSTAPVQVATTLRLDRDHALVEEIGQRQRAVIALGQGAHVPYIFQRKSHGESSR